MDVQPIIITIHTTSDEIAALVAAAHVYLDILEVVEPLEPDRTRRESVHQLGVFQDRCQETDAQAQGQADVLFPMHIPFRELMVVTTAIEAYEFMDKIHCLPSHTSGLTSIEVITRTRSFQQRMVSTSSES